MQTMNPSLPPSPLRRTRYARGTSGASMTGETAQVKRFFSLQTPGPGLFVKVHALDPARQYSCGYRPVISYHARGSVRNCCRHSSVPLVRAALRNRRAADRRDAGKEASSPRATRGRNLAEVRRAPSLLRGSVGIDRALLADHCRATGAFRGLPSRSHELPGIASAARQGRDRGSMLAVEIEATASTRHISGKLLYRYAPKSSGPPTRREGLPLVCEEHPYGRGRMLSRFTLSVPLAGRRTVLAVPADDP